MSSAAASLVASLGATYRFGPVQLDSLVNQTSLAEANETIGWRQARKTSKPSA